MVNHPRIRKLLLSFATSFLMAFSALSFGEIGLKDSLRLQAKNTIYLEIGNKSIYNALIFDHLFNTNKRITRSYSTGLMFSSEFRTNQLDYYIGFPASYNFLFGQKHHKLELGFGLTFYMNLYQTDYYYQDENHEFQFFNTTTSNFLLYFTSRAAYRYQNPKGGLFFRAALSPYINTINRIGGIEHEGTTYIEPKYTTYAFVNYLPRFAVYFGLSLGYTFKPFNQPSK